MSDDKTNNVLQFPGRKKEEAPAHTATSEASKPAQSAAAPKAKAKRKSKKTLAGTVIAIILATGAVNRFAFNNSENLDLSSNGAGRGLASANHSWVRDAKWEREIAEKLASPNLREIASTRIGRSATMEEKLRWGTLEEKYTINYKAENQRIQTIFLQDETSDPSYILDRVKFLKEYGSLFEDDFKGAKLKSVESTGEKTVESYTIFDKSDRAKGEARFELDKHKRLISLKVEPVQI
jgi:hypothetical protein